MTGDNGKRVLVLGAGPAALAAATRLREQAADRVDVELMHMGHNLGGKAATYPDPATGNRRTKEHGWHMLVGFYQRMKGLMKRAGIDLRKTLISMKGLSHPYESFDGRIHTLQGKLSRAAFALKFLGYDGMPAGDRFNFARFMSQAYLEAMSGSDLTAHDDVCFRTWAIENGLRPHITKYSLFRFFQEAYFNFPEAISAYHVLQTLRLMSSPHSAELFVTRGGMSETVWNPIGKYFERLGGRITPYQMATDWLWEGRKIIGVRVVKPDASEHCPAGASWPATGIPVDRGTARIHRDFDYVISTIPVAALNTMNEDNQRMWSSPYFRRLRNLRSASTLSLTVLLRSKYMSDFPGPVFGLPAPLGIAVNMKGYWPEYQRDPNVGAAIAFVGQEAGFESWSDQQIIDFTLDNFSRVAQLGDIRGAGIDHIEFHRNRAPFERLFLCEPGVQQFRPGPLTPFNNLFFAGDWVRNQVDLVCMEGAIASGMEAADIVLSRIGETR